MQLEDAFSHGFKERVHGHGVTKAMRIRTAPSEISVAAVSMSSVRSVGRVMLFPRFNASVDDCVIEVAGKNARGH